MLIPEGVLINGASGGVFPATGQYTKRLSELSDLFQDPQEARRLVAEGGDPVVYTVVEYRQEGADLFFGTTTIEPGDVSGEFFMTRGHYHQRRDMGEVYYTQSGAGILLLESRAGETRTVEMSSGSCALIPPDWAHRSINTGGSKLVFVWVCSVTAGQEYGSILTRGMKKLVVAGERGAQVIENPNHA
jgi:glucose-6-phosphate isomerase